MTKKKITNAIFFFFFFFFKFYESRTRKVVVFCLKKFSLPPGGMAEKEPHLKLILGLPTLLAPLFRSWEIGGTRKAAFSSLDFFKVAASNRTTILLRHRFKDLFACHKTEKKKLYLLHTSFSFCYFFPLWIRDDGKVFNQSDGANFLMLFLPLQQHQANVYVFFYTATNRLSTEKKNT